MLENFHHVLRFTVPFADVDMMQHVNHASYIRWAETGRSEYFSTVMGESINGTRGMILAKIEFTYERQLDYRDEVAIGTRISRIGSKSFDFEYEVRNATASARAAYGMTPMVAYDYEAQGSIIVPQEWRERIHAYERLAPK